MEENNYKVENKSVFDYKICSSDRKHHICLTCHKKLLKVTVSAQALCHDLQVCEVCLVTFKSSKSLLIKKDNFLNRWW